MGALVRSRICCRQFANCWVQLPVPGGAMLGCAVGRGGLKTGRGDGGGERQIAGDRAATAAAGLVT